MIWWMLAMVAVLAVVSLVMALDARRKAESAIITMNALTYSKLDKRDPLIKPGQSEVEEAKKQ